MINLSNSLHVIENKEWNYPEDGSFLAGECKRLWEKPLSKFSIENFRVLIGQKISLEHLIPLAIDILETNPLAEGKLYKGDLLHVVLGCPEGFWTEYPNLNNRLVEVKIELENVNLTITNELLPLINNIEFK